MPEYRNAEICRLGVLAFELKSCLVRRLLSLTRRAGLVCSDLRLEQTKKNVMNDEIAAGDK
jgi:hypothetical protein